MIRGWTGQQGWLSLCLLACALAASATEPTTQPLPRLETGMHTAVITRVDTDAAGRWAVTASQDRTARVWDVASGRLVVVLRPPQDDDNEGKLFATAMSPDGQRVAVAGRTKLGSRTGHTIYLFDRATARLLHRIPDLPDPVLHLAYAPDGRWLAAALQGKGGLRVHDAASGGERGRDTSFGDNAHSVHFSADSRRLVATSFDGRIRLHAVDAEGGLTPLASVQAGGGARPYAARFSPDGRRIAVGFDDRPTVQVLDAQSLTELARPSVAGVNSGNLSRVAWSADGRSLVAGGTWAATSGHAVRRWTVDDWSRHDDVVVSRGTVVDLVALPSAGGGGWLFGAHDPRWGVLDASARVRRAQDAVIADFRGQLDRLEVSSDGRRVRFGVRGDTAMRSFDMPSRVLETDTPPLVAPRTQATGITLTGWRDDADPRMNGERLVLDNHETSRSVALAPDDKRIVLGSEWNLRLFERPGRARWRQPVPGTVWAVNVSGDGRFVVAAFGDGTIRWHRADDGREVLALYPHADGKRWIAWMPQGFYAASGPDAEELFGEHLNRGRDREGEFVSARQLREHFHQPGLISRRLDADGERLLGDAVARLGDVRQVLAEGAKAATPLVEIVDLKVDGDEVTFSVKVTDRGGGVGDLSFYVDGQPQAGRQSGVVGDATSPRTFTPPPGARLIAVAARNRLGIEGPRDTQTVQIAGTQQRGTLHILTVGVDLPPLRHSANDARVLAKELADRASAVFQQVRTPKVLVNEQATLAGIERAFGEIRGDFGPQDTLVIFLAGHGEAPIGRGYTFLPWGYQLGAGGTAGVGLGEKQFREMLAAAPLQTLLLLDTCDAGGAIEMLEASYERLRGSRQVVIGASRRGEFAQEGFDNHGVFTAALLRVMRAKPEHEDERELRVPQLRASVDTEVRRIIRTMSSGSGQKVTGFIGSADFPLLRR